MRTSSSDHYGRAVAYLLFGVAAGTTLDLIGKWLLADYSLVQFVFLRSLFSLVFFVIATRFYAGIDTLTTHRWHWHALRSVLSIATTFGFFFGLARMPIVNALTIAFTAPLLVTALSVPFLGERVGWRCWLAVLAGFGGVIIILRPGGGMFTPAAIAVIIAAIGYAGLALTTRKLAATESSLSLAVYCLAGPLLVSALLLPGDYTPPTSSACALFVLAGLCSALAWVGIVGGYRRAPPAQLSPFEYTALLGAGVAGYLIWGEVPDIWVITGGLVIIGSGLFVAYAQRVPAAAPPIDQSAAAGSSSFKSV